MKDCCSEAQKLMSLDEALASLLASVSCTLGTETLPLDDCLGRVLARDLVSQMPLPPFDHSAMDGYVVRCADLPKGAEARLALAGLRMTAGSDPHAILPPGAAARIFTGAPLPRGGDAVVMQEHCAVEDGHVILPAGIKVGANCRKAGEELQKGAVTIAAGKRLGPAEIAMAATTGYDVLPVYRKLRATVLSTGDELTSPGAPLAPGRVYDSNRFGVVAALKQLGCQTTSLGPLPDTLEAIASTINEAVASSDVIVTSGGMSVGEEDHVKTAISTLGRLDIWRLSIKPGKPVGVGEVQGVPIIGLPGNPVSALVTFALIGRPLILKLAGASVQPLQGFPLPSLFSHSCGPQRREFLRGRLARRADGSLAVDKFQFDSSGAVSSMVDSDGLIDLEAGRAVSEGDLVSFLPFEILR